MSKPIAWSAEQEREWLRYIPRDRTRQPRERSRSLEAAFMDPETGAVVGTGPVHDDDVVMAKGFRQPWNWRPGFIDESGTRWMPKGGDATWTKLKHGQLRSREYAPARKSSERGAGGGDVEVQAHVRNGVNVSSYTRSRPS